MLDTHFQTVDISSKDGNLLSSFFTLFPKQFSIIAAVRTSHLAEKSEFHRAIRKQRALVVLLAVQVYYVEWTLNVEACFRIADYIRGWGARGRGRGLWKWNLDSGWKELNSRGRAPSLRLRNPPGVPTHVAEFSLFRRTGATDCRLIRATDLSLLADCSGNLEPR